MRVKFKRQADSSKLELWSRADDLREKGSNPGPASWMQVRPVTGFLAEVHEQLLA